MLSAQAIKNHHSAIFTFLHGDRALAAPHCHVPDEALRQSLVYVTDAAQLLEDVPNAGAYGGYPLQPLKEALKTAVSIGHLNEIRRNLKRVMRHLHLPENPHADRTPQVVHDDVSES